jgi:UDP-N-acetylglucosamine/UDP-N-acetylgalactosamine diphosphorylase
VFAEQIMAAERAYGVRIPWFVMTSEANHDETERFFEDNRWFGRPRGDSRNLRGLRQYRYGHD